MGQAIELKEVAMSNADENAAQSSQTPDKAHSDRRSGDRRSADLPFDGEDRRKGDRRTGEDRRKNERRSGVDRRNEEPG